MENEIICRPVGRPKGGHLSFEEKKKANAQHNENIRRWKEANLDKIKGYRQSYAERRRAGTVAHRNKSNVNIIQAFLNDIKNISIE